MIKSNSKHRESVSTHAAVVVAAVVVVVVVVGIDVDGGVHKPQICGHCFDFSLSVQDEMMKLKSKHCGSVSWQGFSVVVVVAVVVVGNSVVGGG